MLLTHHNLLSCAQCTCQTTILNQLLIAARIEKTFPNFNDKRTAKLVIRRNGTLTRSWFILSSKVDPCVLSAKYMAHVQTENYKQFMHVHNQGLDNSIVFRFEKENHQC